MTVTVSLPCDELCLLGRVDVRKDALAFDWTNSGIFFRFCGKKIAFHFDTPALAQQLYLQIKIDQMRTRVCVKDGSQTVEIEAPEDGEHRVYCVRVNEVLDDVPLVMRDIAIDGKAPALLAKPSLPSRRMLFLGDSITCGFGILTEGTGNGFKTAEQDGSQTYAALTAAHFQAQAHFICISGRGVVRNCDDFQAPRIPDFFEQTTVSQPTAWDHAAYQPDVVVVNAGTNDTAGEGNAVDVDVFKNGVKTFINRLLSVYPYAKIIWGYGMMATDLHEAIRETVESIGNDRVFYLPFQSAHSMENETGACFHPNQRAHYRCAGVLIDKVCEVTGWQK